MSFNLDSILKKNIGKISFEEFIILSFYIFLEKKDLINENKDILINIINYKENFEIKRKLEYDNLKNDYVDVDVDVDVDVVNRILELNPSNSNSFSAVFYTPHFLSFLLKKISEVNKNEYSSIYDPTCGGGSLLSVFDKEKNFYGQELEFLSSNIIIARLLLLGVKKDNIHIINDDTIIRSGFIDKKFDVIVSNPPFGISYDNNKQLLNDPRYSECGILAPKSTADFNFILNNIYHLHNEGINLNIVSPGLLFRGNSEAKIRKFLIEKNYVDCIIDLPSKLFTYTQIPTSILILKKNKKDTKTLFINAKDEFECKSKNNIISDDNMKNIIELYKKRGNVEGKSALVDLDTIQKNDYQLSTSSYIEVKEKNEEIEDIVEFNKKLIELRKKINENYKKIDIITAQIEGNIDLIFESQGIKDEEWK